MSSNRFLNFPVKECFVDLNSQAYFALSIPDYIHHCFPNGVEGQSEMKANLKLRYPSFLVSHQQDLRPG